MVIYHIRKEQKSPTKHTKTKSDLGNFVITLPKTNSSPMKITTFPGKYHQNDGFSSQLC